jgi:hypothetical protein
LLKLELMCDAAMQLCLSFLSVEIWGATKTGDK